MGLKGYRLWVMGQLDSNVQSPTPRRHPAVEHRRAVDPPARVPAAGCQMLPRHVHHLGPPAEAREHLPHARVRVY